MTATPTLLLPLSSCRALSPNARAQTDINADIQAGLASIQAATESTVNELWPIVGLMLVVVGVPALVGIYYIANRANAPILRKLNGGH